MPPPRRKSDVSLISKLGKNVQREREKAKMTQERLAEIVEIDPRALQKIEAGDSDPQSSTLIRIKNAIGCSWESLIPATTRP